jgi:hypothetical protein
VFPRYHNDKLNGFYDFAHNDYVQIAAETGVVGLLLCGAVVLGALWQALRAMRLRRDSLMRGTAFGVTMAICWLLIHSSVDFNLQMPATSFTTTVILALAWIAASCAGSRRREHGDLRCPGSPARHPPRGSRVPCGHSRAAAGSRPASGPPFSIRLTPDGLGDQALPGFIEDLPGGEAELYRAQLQLRLPRRPAQGLIQRKGELDADMAEHVAGKRDIGPGMAGGRAQPGGLMKASSACLTPSPRLRIDQRSGADVANTAGGQGQNEGLGCPARRPGRREVRQRRQRHLLRPCGLALPASQRSKR